MTNVRGSSFIRSLHLNSMNNQMPNSNLNLIVANLFNSFFGTSALCEKINIDEARYIVMLSEFNMQAITCVDRRRYALFIHRCSALIVHVSLSPKRFIIDRGIETVGAIINFWPRPILLLSCYLSPSITVTQNRSNLIYTFLDHRRFYDVIFGGDINAEHASWSLSQSISSHKKAKRRNIHNFFIQCGLVPVVSPVLNNYTRVGSNGNKSWLDVILVSNGMLDQFDNYRVQDAFSDHRMLHLTWKCNSYFSSPYEYCDKPCFEVFSAEKFDR